MWIEDDFDDRDRKSQAVLKEKAKESSNATDLEPSGNAERIEGSVPESGY
jgi:hypothetical protein